MSLSNTTLLMVYIYIIYYININYMFRLLAMAIFRLRLKKLSKQLYSTYVGCIQWGRKRWGGYEISHVLCRIGGVGTWPHSNTWCRSVLSTIITLTCTLCDCYKGADKSLARPGRKHSRKNVRDARDFNKTETRAVIRFFPCTGVLICP